MCLWTQRLTPGHCTADPTQVPGFRGSKHAGVSVYDLSDPSHPALLQRWDAPTRVEGQDRLGSTLVVTEISNGRLYTFNPDDIATGPIATCNLSENGALHVRLYAHPSGKTFAMVTSGFATKRGLPGGARALMAVDVTDHANPREVAKIQTHLPWSPEGIFVSDNRGYVGGVNDTKFSSYDLIGLGEDPPVMTFLHTVSDPAYKQCVAQNSQPSNTGDPTMYAALWTRPGGIGIFDVSAADGTAPEVGRLVIPSLAMTNRIVLFRDRTRALLPLEDHPGGVAVVDVTDPKQPTLVAQSFFTGGRDTCYCACAHGEYIYAFAANAAAMHVFRLPGAP